MSRPNTKKPGRVARQWKKEKESTHALLREVLQHLKDCRKNVGENFYRDLIVGINVGVIHADNSTVLIKFDFDGVALKKAFAPVVHDNIPPCCITVADDKYNAADSYFQVTKD